MSAASSLVIHVVAQLKPAACGVSDFSLAIAGELESGFGICSAFAVVNSKLSCDVEYPRVYRPQSQLLEACRSLSEGRKAALLVHLSGYGFSRDGAPTELAAELSRVKQSGEFRLGVYFHELFATAPPWRTAFWHSRRQQRAVRQIAAECDLLVTNTERHASWLEREAPIRSGLPILRLPVTSNVGEARSVSPWDTRTPSLVVFGLPATRKRAYEHLASLRSVLGELGIEEIVDIGPPLEIPAQLNGIPVKRMGALPSSELADLLDYSKFGFVQHHADCLAKSGVFAGFCAHGTIPVLAEPFDEEIDGLKDGEHLVSLRTARAASAAGLERCSLAAWAWYWEHRLHVHAETYSRFLAQQSAADTIDMAGQSYRG
jgi:hypothetical protein